MKELKRAYKIEINPTQEQKTKIHQTIGVSRFVYNFFILLEIKRFTREKESLLVGLIFQNG